MKSIENLKKLLDQATPAPWKYVTREGGAINCIDVFAPRVLVERTEADRQLHADARLIAEARNTMPALLEELRAARMVVAAARKIEDADPWSGHLQNMLAYYDATTVMQSMEGE